jgi:hypothetical protein
MYLGYPDLRVFIVLVALYVQPLPIHVHRQKPFRPMLTAPLQNENWSQGSLMPHMCSPDHLNLTLQALFSSNDSSLATHVELIRRTDCTLVLYTDGFPIAGILEMTRMEAVCLPELEVLLDKSPCDLYAYSKTFEEAKHDPVFILQATRSAAMSKPVRWTHWSISRSDNRYLLSSRDGELRLDTPLPGTSKRIYCASSMFQGSGLVDGLREVCYNTTIVVLSRMQAVTTDSFSDMIEYADVDAATCMSCTLEDVAMRPDVLAKLDRLEYISYVGGQ